MIMMKRASMKLQPSLDDPAMDAPPGMHHNFVNPFNMKIEYRITMIFCLVIFVLAVSMRMWTKARLIRKVVLEDLVCCLALIAFAIAFAVNLILQQKIKSGVHLWNVSRKDLSIHLYYSRISNMVYFIVIYLIKLAILLQYLRAFVPLKQRNWMFWACHTLIWLHFMFSFVMLFLTLFTCRPVEKYWKPWIEGKCFTYFTLLISASAINAFFDIVIVILPQPIIWNLRISFKRKIGLSAISCVGIFACVSAALRIYAYIKGIQTHDTTHYSVISGIWIFVEATLGILAACLPTLPRFLANFEKSTFWSYLRKSFHGLVRPKIQPKTSEPRYDENQATTATTTHDIEPNDSTARLKTCDVLPNDIELVVSTSTEKYGDEKITEDDHPGTENPRTELQIMRTVHIATTHEAAAAAATTSKMPISRYSRFAI